MSQILNVEIENWAILFTQVKSECFDLIKPTLFVLKRDSCWRCVTFLEVTFQAGKMWMENFTLDVVTVGISLVHAIKFNPTVGGHSWS